MNEPTPEQIVKLPKWAQEHLKYLTYKLNAAARQLDEFHDKQEPSPFYVDEWYSTPRRKRFIKCPQRRVCIDHLGIHCEIFLPFEGDGQRLQGIEITYREVDRAFNVKSALVPRGLGAIQIVNMEHMR